MPNINSNIGQVRVEGYPNKCPFCHKSIIPVFLYGYKGEPNLEIMLGCPDQQCKRSFIGYYRYMGTNYSFNGNTTQGTIIGRKFSATIQDVSKNFVIIYNQAFSAEQQKLTEICGVGYRKALEFLIKDYIIANKPDDKEKVEKKLLGVCISDFVNDQRIKSVAKRAAWLGNDETHYVRKWEGKNLEDLKKLIDLTVHWIEMEVLTKSFETDMPE